jgi:hypothetical protein
MSQFFKLLTPSFIEYEVPKSSLFLHCHLFHNNSDLLRSSPYQIRTSTAIPEVYDTFVAFLCTSTLLPSFNPSYLSDLQNLAFEFGCEPLLSRISAQLEEHKLESKVRDFTHLASKRSQLEIHVQQQIQENKPYSSLDDLARSLTAFTASGRLSQQLKALDKLTNRISKLLETIPDLNWIENRPPYDHQRAIFTPESFGILECLGGLNCPIEITAKSTAFGLPENVLLAGRRWQSNREEGNWICVNFKRAIQVRECRLRGLFEGSGEWVLEGIGRNEIWEELGKWPVEGELEGKEYKISGWEGKKVTQIRVRMKEMGMMMLNTIEVFGIVDVMGL